MSEKVERIDKPKRKRAAPAGWRTSLGGVVAAAAMVIASPQAGFSEDVQRWATVAMAAAMAATGIAAKDQADK